MASGGKYERAHSSYKKQINILNTSTRAVARNFSGRVSGTSLPSCKMSCHDVVNHLERDALKITEWFPNNVMKLNEDKCHLMKFGLKGDTEVTIKIGEACIKESKEQRHQQSVHKRPIG